MYCLIAAEAAMFTIFVVAYLFYAGASGSGPTPHDVLHPPIVFSICLLSSSLTIHRAVKSWQRGAMSAFAAWWLATIALGAAFLVGTALEWRDLIGAKGLTIQTNLFGTTYYALVGLHAVHVTAGLVALTLVSAFAFLGYVRAEHAGRGEVLSIYWHFVDGVWVVVFMVVYVIGR
ncbi:MAG: cytochrome c oxidase, subunit [Acidobacteria bacterium]|nr:cytochrome c oxidase, subunit [Acidobacteriota bacterium]